MRLNPFRRKPSAQPTRRQRLRGALDEAPTPFSYRSQRSGSGQEDGRNRFGKSEVSSPKRRRTRGSGLKTSVLVLGLAAVACLAGYTLLLSPPAQVVRLSGGSQAFLRSDSVYKDFINQKLNGSILNRTKITFNSTKLSQQLRQEFPELASATVTLPLISRQPLVYVESAHPVVELAASNGSFLIDNSGRAFARSVKPGDYATGNVPLLNDQSGVRLSLNQQALPAKDVKFIQTVIAQLAAKQFRITAMTLPASARQVDAELAGQPYQVKFNLQNENPRGQAGTFLATATELKRRNITPVKYIDVRVNGRAYYQ